MEFKMISKWCKEMLCTIPIQTLRPTIKNYIFLLSKIYDQDDPNNIEFLNP